MKSRVPNLGANGSRSQGQIFEITTRKGLDRVCLSLNTLLYVLRKPHGRHVSDVLSGGH